MDTRVLSFDIETYGKASADYLGRPLPAQRFFHPVKARYFDRPTTPTLTASITLVNDPRPTPSTPWSAQYLSRITPGDTMVFLLHRPDHVGMLARWLSGAETILGMNLLFDVPWTRNTLPNYTGVLDGRQTLIDLSVVKALWNEVTQEKSLKDMGPALSLFRYADDIKDTVYPRPDHPDLIHYNAEDTHNTALAIAEYARLILRDYGDDTSKLSSSSISYFSNLCWSTVRMLESGIPFDTAALRTLHSRCTAARGAADATLAKTSVHITTKNFTGTTHFRLEGKNSSDCRVSALTDIFNYIDETAPLAQIFDGDEGSESIYASPLTALTPKTARLSTATVNRELAQAILPRCPDNQTTRDYIAFLDDWEARDTANNLLNRHLNPLLFQRTAANTKNPLDTRLIPCSGPLRRGLAYPQIFLVPSDFKDGSGDSGGQRQARPSFTKPSAQQFPPELKAHIRSRHRNGVLIAGDLSQIELRVPTVYSGEASMLRVFTAGGDLHTDRATFAFGPDIIHDPNFRCGDMRKDPRQWAKKFNFEDLYWAGGKKMQAMLLKDARRIFPLSFFRQVEYSRPVLRPQLYEWQQRTIHDTTARGYYELPITGHSRYFMGGSAVRPNEILNFPIQSVAAITLCWVQNRIHQLLPSLSRRNPPIHLFLNWFDAIFGDCESRQAAADFTGIFNRALSECASSGYWHQFCSLPGHTPVPLKCEIKEFNSDAA